MQFITLIRLRFILLQISGLISVILVFLELPVHSQVIPDRTLGNENSVVVPNQRIRGIPSDAPSGAATLRIHGGAIRGGNLFHSFQEFNIDEGRGVYFYNPDNIVNIITRVTGDKISNIFGTLGVLGNANLFLMNPNGIVFGPNARLDVGGSFFATTADGILFENGVEFAASNLEAPPLLTINIPLGLNIRENPGRIVNQASNSVGLQVQPRNTLGLIGGEIYLEGGLLKAEAGRIELGSVANNSFIRLIPIETGLTLGYEEVNNFQDIFLSSGAIVDVTGEKAGNIQIQGRNLIVDQSKIRSITLGDEPGGTLTVQTSESVQLTGQGLESYRKVRDDVISGNANNLSTLEVYGLITGTQAAGNAASISVETPLLRLQEGAALLSPTWGLGAAGNIDVRASQVEIIGSSLFTPAIKNSMGAAGNITVNTGTTGQLILRDDGELYSPTFGHGAAGNITINSGDVEVTRSLLTTASTLGASGSAGDITIDANRLSIRDTGVFSTTTSGNGAGGNITIRASESVEIVGTGIDSLETLEDGTFDEGVGFDLLTLRQVTETPSPATETPNRITGLVAGTQKGLGNAGEIIISTPSLRLDNGALISSPTLGQGNAGEININASNIEITASQLFTAAAQNSTGVAGDINIDTHELVLRDQGAIFSPTVGEGNGGRITIDASNVEIINSLITTAAANSSRGGNAGDITITTDQLTLSNTGTIVSATASTGQGGNIFIRASESIELIGSGVNKAQQAREGVLEPPNETRDRKNVLTIQDGFVAGTEGSGNAGDITIVTPLLQLRNGAVIFTPTRGEGRGGDITVNASTVELVSSIITSAAAFDATGDAGDIRIHTEQLRIQESGEIFSPTFGQGLSGKIDIDASNVEIIRSLLTTTAADNSTGAAGTIDIETESLTVRDESTIAVNSRGSGKAGNVIIEAHTLRLDNQAVLTAETRSGEGNIIIDGQDLIMRRNSKITTNATGEVKGGNIEINTDTFLVAIEDSDISANAEAAFGGQVIIDANAILGTQFRQQPTNASDITATSELGPAFSGTVQLNTEVDPSSGLIELPQTIVDPAALINQNFCKQGRDSRFIIIGRGGLPPNPRDPQSVDLSRVEPIEIVPSDSTQQLTISPQQLFETLPPSNDTEERTSDNIIPARGWIRNQKGEVILVSYDPTQVGVRRQPYNFNPCQPQTP